MSAADASRPASATADAGPAVTWHVPPDGGTPRDPAGLIPLGPLELRVLARAEEGRSPLSHALSRVDLLCRNATAAPLPVTVHIDLSGAATSGARTNFDDSPFGGMPKRDFVYIRHRPSGAAGPGGPGGPGGASGSPWQRVDGTTEGWTVSVTFDVPPGETRLGLSPPYDYAEYLAYVNALPEHPCLRRRLLGLSDGGREHWELTVTDPTVPAADKERVYWHTREHAYETFSSYAIEGLIDYLLSPEAAAVRRRYEITLHPMTNVDGVAEGAEYRGGYDFPDPLGTTTARLTRETVDRLRPELIVAWHNWHAPRDVDSLFFTDADGAGRPTRRAFDRFTQRFPSPRRVGHRWQTEDDPQQRNWAVRLPTPAQAQANSHQYGRLHYGSRVWGWEMPWYGRDDTDGADPLAHARRAGADFGRAFFATQASLAADPDVPAVPPAAGPVPDVPRWGTHEFVLSGETGLENPFRDAALIGEFTSPGGRLVTVEGFYDPEEPDSPASPAGAPAALQRWRLRFAPDEVGEWPYRLRGEGVALYAEGTLRCVAPAGPGPHGPIGIDPQHPYAFAHAGGEPFFGVGDTCYGLVTGISAAQRREYLDTRAAQGFNFVRLYASGYPLQAHPTLDPAETWPWGGTPDAPDYDRLNPRFFRRLESVLTEVAARGLRAEILVFNLYLLQAGHGARNPWGTAARERLWVRYLLARLAASPVVFLWTVANEFECYPDGAYRFDPGDVRWARRMGALLHDRDPYGHPTTVHPMGLAGGGLVRAQGPLFGQGPELDVLTHQHNSYDTATRVDTAQGAYWDGSGRGVDAALRADRVHRKPVINTEFGYEWLPGYPNDFNGQAHGTDKCRRTAWRIVAAGGAALAAGFSGTWHGRDATFRGRPAPFTVADAGAAVQLGILARAVAGLPLNRLQPFEGVTVRPLAQGERERGAAGNPDAAGDPATAAEALALADPGRTYLVYLPAGGRVTLDLGAAAGPFAARWLDPRSGARGAPLSVPGGGLRVLESPDAADWVLTLTAAS